MLAGFIIANSICFVYSAPQPFLQQWNYFLKNDDALYYRQRGSLRFTKPTAADIISNRGFSKAIGEI